MLGSYDYHLPGRCGNLFPVLKQTDGISLAEAKAEACRSAVILINYKISVCWNGCSFWNGVGILILIILQHKTGNAQLISVGLASSTHLDRRLGHWTVLH